jgi:NAD(P)-dependent dehydrogenase (short-subunit alcohol dehydrogenase family)
MGRRGPVRARTKECATNKDGVDYRREPRNWPRARQRGAAPRSKKGACRQSWAPTDPRSAITALTLEVTSASDVQPAVDEVETLDVLINNAGVAIYNDDRAHNDRRVGVLLSSRAQFISRSPMWRLMAGSCTPRKSRRLAETARFRCCYKIAQMAQSMVR